MTSTLLDAQARATILAALAFYAAQGQGDPAARTDLVHALATDDDHQVSMDDAGIAHTFRLIAESETITLAFEDAMPPEPPWTSPGDPGYVTWGPRYAAAVEHAEAAR